MKIPIWLFMSFWAITGLVFLRLGFNALDRTSLSDSVSPFVMFHFKHALAFSLLHSSHYAFVYLPVPEIDIVKHLFWVGNALNPLILWSWKALGPWYFLYCALINIWAALDKERSISAIPGVRIGLEIDFIIKLSMYYAIDDTHFFTTWLLATAAFTSSIWHTMFHDEPAVAAAKQKKNPIRGTYGETIAEYWLGVVCAIIYETENSSLLKKIVYKRRELIKFGIGMLGTIFFQNFFRLNTIDHVLAFLYLAVAWLANLALLQANTDAGIFNFLLANVIVGCTVSQFGLRGPTWLAFGASVLLYGLRLKVDSMTSVYWEQEKVSRGLGRGLGVGISRNMPLVQPHVPRTKGSYRR